MFQTPFNGCVHYMRGNRFSHPRFFNILFTNTLTLTNNKPTKKMGLDQQAYTKDKDGQCETIQDWRKHNALDGWMQSLWTTKGGSGEWNCSEVELNAHDIEQLEAVVINDELPETHGFFYGGDSRECPYRKQETLDFIKEAGKLLSKGEKVYYSAWF